MLLFEGTSCIIEFIIPAIITVIKCRVTVKDISRMKNAIDLCLCGRRNHLEAHLSSHFVRTNDPAGALHSKSAS